jgi:cysteinyl-tRNA synthetase
MGLKLENALHEDLNTPILIAELFDVVTKINLLASGQLNISESDLSELKKLYSTYVFDILGLKKESEASSEKIQGVMQLLIDLRQEAKQDKNYALSDTIRKKLSEIGIELKDGKEGTSFTIN